VNGLDGNPQQLGHLFLGFFEPGSGGLEVVRVHGSLSRVSGFFSILSNLYHKVVGVNPEKKAVQLTKDIAALL
jgi:hypothetical protein